MEIGRGDSPVQCIDGAGIFEVCRATGTEGSTDSGPKSPAAEDKSYQNATPTQNRGRERLASGHQNSSGKSDQHQNRTSAKRKDTQPALLVFPVDIPASLPNPVRGKYEELCRRQVKRKKRDKKRQGRTPALTFLRIRLKAEQSGRPGKPRPETGRQDEISGLQFSSAMASEMAIGIEAAELLVTRKSDLDFSGGIPALLAVAVISACWLDAVRTKRCRRRTPAWVKTFPWHSAWPGRRV